MECSGSEIRFGAEVPMIVGWTLVMEVTALLLVPIMVETIPYDGTKVIRHFSKQFAKKPEFFCNGFQLLLVGDPSKKNI